MPDNLDELPVRLARDLASVRWPEPGVIRARARRRTIMTVVVAPLAVLLVVVGVGVGLGWRAWFGGDALPVAGNPISTGPSDTSTTIAPSLGPQDPQWIPDEALLQPEDVATGQSIIQALTNEAGQLDLWLFTFDGCPAYPDLGVTAYRQHQFMRINQIAPADKPGLEGSDTLFVQTGRYPDQLASTVVTDIRRSVQACTQYDREGGEASTPARPAHATFTWTLLDEAFAGDDSLLIHESVGSVADDTQQQIGEPIVMVFAVVRVNDLVTIISRYSTDPIEVMLLGERAVPRLCTAAIPRC
jgi:hypothetical protein